VERHTRKWFDLQHDGALPTNFEQLGYSSTYFIVSLGTMFYILIVQILILLLLGLTSKLKNRTFKRYRKKIKD